MGVEGNEGGLAAAGNAIRAAAQTEKTIGVSLEDLTSLAAEIALLREQEAAFPAMVKAAEDAARASAMEAAIAACEGALGMGDGDIAIDTVSKCIQAIRGLGEK